MKKHAVGKVINTGKISLNHNFVRQTYKCSNEIFPQFKEAVTFICFRIVWQNIIDLTVKKHETFLSHLCIKDYSK